MKHALAIIEFTLMFLFLLLTQTKLASGSKNPDVTNVKSAIPAQSAPDSAMPDFLPQLSTAERIALQTCEKAKSDAQKQFQEAAQQEQAIMVQFSATHPGYHLNGTTFAVEHDQPKPVQPALPTKK